jgi:dodecin
MSVAKVIEVIAESSESFDDAVRQGVSDASATVKNIKSVWVKEMTGVVENNEVTRYRVTMKVTFVVGK